MATRGTIALEFADGTVQSVYCHYDNYLEGTGKILQEHYMDPFKVRQLIDLGDLSSLGADIGEKHDFDSHNSWGNMCLFYGRDRGETGVEAQKYASLKDYLNDHEGEEYDYIMRIVAGQSMWFVRFDDEWISLSEALLLEEEV